MAKAELKDRLKKAMELNDMKQADLVNIGNFDKGKLSSWLSGKYRPRQESIDKLSRILGVSEAWLMGYDIPMERMSDSERFQEWVSEYNESHNPLMVSENEKSMVEKYRILDEHGKKVVDLIINEEYSRCKEERESEISLSKDELAKLPYEERLKFLRFENGDGLKLVARRNDKHVRK